MAGFDTYEDSPNLKAGNLVLMDAAKARLAATLEDIATGRWEEES